MPLPPGLPAIPITPEMLATLGQMIASGVTEVQYGDRRISYMSLAELLRAYDWLAAQVVGGAVGTPVRRVAVFSKGLDWTFGSVEGGEFPR